MPRGSAKNYSIQTATRADIDEVIEILHDFMQLFDERSGASEKKLVSIDQRVGNLEKLYHQMESRMTDMEVRQGSVERKVDRISDEQMAMAADIKDILINLDKINDQIESGQYKQKEMEQKLIALHDWVERAGKTIGLTFHERR